MKYKLLALSLALLAVACGGNGNQEPTPEEVPGPALVSTDPADGATGLTGASLSIRFTFDQTIACTADGIEKITVDGGAFKSGATPSGSVLTVTVSGLSPGKSYTVSLPAGTVKGYKQNQKGSAAITFRFSMKEADPVEPDSWETAAAAVKNMGVGWNMGNTLESNSGDADNMWIEAFTERRPTDYENAWGQTDATRALIHLFKEAGFNAIRVPVTWYPHMGTLSVTTYQDGDGNWHGRWDKAAWMALTPAEYKVDRVWMSRVKEVVGYVLDEGMYCILNVHHDTGTSTAAWLRADQAVYDAVKERYCNLWTEIATEFESFGPKLLFESFNEMLDATNTWNYVSAAADALINRYNADFVTTVRATGGNNAKRNLVLNTYAASTDERVLKDFELPEDSAKDHLIAEVHSYAPYRFAFNSQWSQTTFDDACAQEVRAIVDGLNQHLLARGIPCLIGEYGADATDRLEAELAKQAACYVSQAAKYNIACFYWMGLVDGKEDRAAPRWTKPTLRDAILKAYNDNKNH